MHALVTGGHGFVGTWLCEWLKECGDEVVAPPESVDVTDAGAMCKAVGDAAPEVVYHLAAASHVGESWNWPQEVFRVNALGTLNVLQAAGAIGRRPRVIVISSAEVYGRVDAKDLPITEDHPLHPATPYAASKVAAEFCALQAYFGRRADVVVVRPFNHVGPRQSDRFVVSALARRVIEARKAGSRRVAVGNLESRRDYCDVRDVVRAYRMLAEEGEPGSVYQVCSGRDRSVGEIGRSMAEAAGVEIEFVPDPELSRATDVPVLRGDYGRLHAATGWAPKIDIDETLADVLEYWEGVLSA